MTVQSEMAVLVWSDTDVVTVVIQIVVIACSGGRCGCLLGGSCSDYLDIIVETVEREKVVGGELRDIW